MWKDKKIKSILIFNHAHILILLLYLFTNNYAFGIAQTR